eukprot:4325826-Amphidinium_carterae.1
MARFPFCDSGDREESASCAMPIATEKPQTSEGALADYIARSARMLQRLLKNHHFDQPRRGNDKSTSH